MASRTTEKQAGGAPPSVWRVAVYIRLSREDGEDESLSVVNQRKVIADYLEQKFSGEHVIAGWYIDDGISGTDYDRPAFQRMMRDVEEGRADCVICKTLSRAFRNYSDQGYFLENVFPRLGIRFISISAPAVDSFTNPEAISGLEVPITGLMNDRFAAQTSDAIRRTFDAKRKRGEFIGAFAPYGYEKDSENKNKLVIDEVAAQVVRDIFLWFVQEGMSKAGIVKRLNERGIPNPSAYKRAKGMKYCNPSTPIADSLWSPKTVGGCLQNPVYCGSMVQGKQKVISYKVHDRVAMPRDKWYVVPKTHEPLVSDILFDQAQDLCLRGTRTANGEAALSLFAGFIRCWDCKKALYRRPSKGYVYYVCRTFGEKSKSQCTKHSIRADVLEGVVLAAVRMQILLAAQVSETLARLSDEPLPQTKTSRFDELLHGHRLEAAKLRNALDSLYLDWKNGDISKADHRRMKDKFDGQLARIARSVADLEAEQRQAKNSEKSKESSPFAYFLKHRNIERLDRGVLSALVDTVFVHARQEITVRFKFSEPFGWLMALASGPAAEPAIKR